MTREEAKDFMWIENDKNPTIIRWQNHSTISGLVSNLIDKIFDEHGEQLQNKDDEIELLKHRIEEAMKPKTCLGCLHCNKAYQLASRPPQYKLNCGVFKTVFVNDFKQYCSRYEPKVTP